MLSRPWPSHESDPEKSRFPGFRDRLDGGCYRHHQYAARLGPASVDFPGSGHTSVLGISANGDVVGAYNVKEVGADKDVRGYVLRGDAFTEIDFPSARGTLAFGINDSGDIVGTYQDVSGTFHGYVRGPEQPKRTNDELEFGEPVGQPRVRAILSAAFLKSIRSASVR